MQKEFHLKQKKEIHFSQKVTRSKMIFQIPLLFYSQLYDTETNNAAERFFFLGERVQVSALNKCPKVPSHHGIVPGSQLFVGLDIFW